jgi:copper chaperone
METKKYATNLRCGGCLAKVKPGMDSEPSIISWEVDLETPDKELTVTLESGTNGRVEQIFEDCGFEAREKRAIFKNIFG